MEKQARKHADVSPAGGGRNTPSVLGGGQNNFVRAKKHPLKKKERDSEMMIRQPRSEMFSTDHEMFLQAFEKPTQIYRFLQAKNSLQPIFLHRNLSYMRHRMSRSHKSRQSFKIDSMLAQKMAKLRNEKSNGLTISNGYLKLLFLGFFDEKNQTNRNSVDNNGIVLPLKNSFVDDEERTDCDYKCVQVETNLLKIAHTKRKDVSATQMQLTVGKSQVLVNPKTDPLISADSSIDEKPAVVSIPTDSFNTTGAANHVTGPQVSFILRFRVHYTVPGCMSNSTNGCYLTNGAVKEEEEEPSAKRQKLHSHSKLYSTELAIIDNSGHCLLKEADYELAAQEIISQQKTMAAKYGSPIKNRFWASLPEAYDILSTEDCKPEVPPTNEDFIDRYEKMIKPFLKVRLQWTKEPPRGFDGLSIGHAGCNVGTGDAMGMGYSDKENHKPISLAMESYKKGLNININNNSILTPAAASGIMDSIGNSSNSGGAGVTEDESMDVKPIRPKLEPSPSDETVVPTADVGSTEKEAESKRVIYYFIYNNYSRQQTENDGEYRCPWCRLSCGVLYSLLKHLKLCHARFNFNYVPIPNGARIDITVNELYDGSYNGSPHDLLAPSLCYELRGPLRRTVVTNLLVCRPRRQKPSLTEFIDNDETEFDSQRPYITGHSRMYHHTMTCLPVYPRELDVDSEGESDPLWLQHKTMQLIDEFTDVNEGEKELMKMWNLHVMKYGYVGDCQIPIALEMFVERRGRELIARNLYRNFVLHMCSMFDFGLVSAEVMQRITRKLKKMSVNDSELQQAMKESRTEQMSYWNNVTVHKQQTVKAETRNGCGDRTAGAGASTSTSSGSLSYHLHKAGHGGSGGASTSNAGNGPQRKVKPSMTPMKNMDPAAISPPRRRSASVAVKGTPTSTTASPSSIKPAIASSHSTATVSKPSSTSAVSSSSTASKSSANYNKKSSHIYATGTASASSSSSSSPSLSSNANHPQQHQKQHPQQHQHSLLKAMFSPIMTRRKSLSLGTHLSQLQRKRSLN